MPRNTPTKSTGIVLMEAFLPGVGDWNNVFLLRDLWHFHFFGKTPLALVTGRERIYLEHFWNDFAADATKSVPEADRKFYAKEYARPGHMKAGMEVFRAFPKDAEDFAELREDQTVDADAGAVRRKGRRPVPDRAGQDGRDQCRGRAGEGSRTLADGGGAGSGDSRSWSNFSIAKIRPSFAAEALPLCVTA